MCNSDRISVFFCGQVESWPLWWRWSYAGLGRGTSDFNPPGEICVRTLCTFTKCYKKSRSVWFRQVWTVIRIPVPFWSILNFITHSDIDRVLRRYSDKVSSLRERAFELCVDVRSAPTKYHWYPEGDFLTLRSNEYMTYSFEVSVLIFLDRQ